MIKPNGIEIILTQEHKAKICLDQICNFLSLVKEEISYNKPNFTTKDYKLEQYVYFITKNIPAGTTLYDFQCYIGKKIDLLNPKCIKKGERLSKGKRS